LSGKIQISAALPWGENLTPIK